MRMCLAQGGALSSDVTARKLVVLVRQLLALGAPVGCITLQEDSVQVCACL